MSGEVLVQVADPESTCIKKGGHLATGRILPLFFVGVICWGDF